MCLLERPEEICTCNHSHFRHGWGHPLLGTKNLKPQFATQIQRYYGRCLAPGCSCAHFIWMRDASDPVEQNSDNDGIEAAVPLTEPREPGLPIYAEVTEKVAGLISDKRC